MIPQLNLSQTREKRLQALAEAADIGVSDLITIFIEDLLDRQEDLQKWFENSFENRKDSSHEILENIYFYWVQKYSLVDNACDQLEELFAQRDRISREGKMIEVLAELQEKSFWEGARMVRRLQEILSNL